MNILEIVKMKFEPYQNEALERSFMSFYKLDCAPKIKRELFVEKAEYTRYIKSITRARTQFEAAPATIDLSFDSFRVPFQFIATKTEFLFPNGRNLVLDEELTEPNGLTKQVVCTENIGEEVIKHTFDSYFNAEQFILEQFLKGKNGNGN